jgi:hypothetical protein
LSGVGRHSPNLDRYIAPASYDARWNDKGYQFTDSDEIRIGGGPYSGTHTFIMHAHCCSLLEHFFHPRPIPLARLVKVCRSCPVQGYRFERYLSWGLDHSYEREILRRNAFPWEEPDNYVLHLDRSSRPQNPWIIPELMTDLQMQELGLDETREKKSRRARVDPWTRTRRNKEMRAKRYSAKHAVGDIVSNIFTKLPPEMLEMVLTYVPTNGVKSLALTSKGLKMVIPSRLGQSFWASRFQAPFEYGFVFEAQTYGHGLDWKSLYFEMKNSHSPRLRNRRRIWRLIQSLSELICLQWNSRHGLLPLKMTRSDLRWKAVRGALQQPPEKGQERPEFRFNRGCLQFHSQCTAIPTLLCRIVVSTISIGSATFVTGMRFISRNKLDVCIGYTKGEESSLDITGIQGFIVAVGSRGIHALQLITSTEKLSQWFGDPNGVPKTRRLVTHMPITALRAGFDVSFVLLLISCLANKVILGI